MKNILKIIKSIDTQEIHLNPTEIYNEGWMTRLLVYHSIQEKLKINGIDFGKINNWTSEALIASPFINEDARPRKEGYTHADMAIGDFQVDYAASGKIVLNPDAKLFGIIEAKMKSNLSQGTSNASTYNQASRNVACIADLVKDTPCQTFFGVVAPAKTLSRHSISEQIRKENILSQIKGRFEPYSTEFKIKRKMDVILKKAKDCKVWMLSYEDWIASFETVEVKETLHAFYQKALKWNRV